MTPTSMPSRPQRRILRIICLGILGAIAAAGLRPFNPFPPNDATWVAGGNGLHFGGAGIALSASNLPWPPSASGPTCSLELWLRPDTNTRANNILTFYTPEAPQGLRLFQWADSTLLLYRDFGGEHREIDIEEAFRPRVPVFITVTGSPAGTSVYLDGVLRQRSTRLILSPGDLSAQIILGTSPLADESWSGEIRALAVYGAELTPAQVSQHFEAWSQGERPATQPDEVLLASYDFSEGSGNVARGLTGIAPDLAIPKSFLIPHKRFLTLPTKEFQGSQGFRRDVLINIAGFVVLGFFFCAYRAANFATASAGRADAASAGKIDTASTSKGWAALQALAAGFLISLSIEALQMFLPTRTSSIVDLGANTLGSALGALLALAVLFLTPAPKAEPS
jgi:VanZ like family/Concanavalin A-like lectin/glucanases superfamily